jgi:CubicO group peptidase (beta-lactamase class C family)
LERNHHQRPTGDNGRDHRGTDPNAASNLPISAMQMAEWLASQALGNVSCDKTQANYGNASYMLLGMLIAKLRGKSSFIEGIHEQFAGAAPHDPYACMGR